LSIAKQRAVGFILAWSLAFLQRTEKLTKRFIGPYKIKKIISSDVVELELSSIVKVHSIVNVTRI